MPDVSVIVPVYNAAATLLECLGNLLHQTKPEIEIILIDDASTDGSPQIMEDARAQFGECVKVLRLATNGGPGAARNLGIEASSGKYIGFVDADDLVDPSMYEMLYQAAVQSQADIVDCAFYRASQQTASIHFPKAVIGTLDHEKRGVLISSGGFIVTKIFKRELLFDHHIRFRCAYGLEDMDFLMEAIAYAKRIDAVEEILYHYRDTEASLSKEINVDSYFTNHMTALEGIYNRLSVLPDYEEIKMPAEYAMLALYRNVVNHTIANKASIEEAHALRLLEEALKARKRCISCRLKDNPMFRDKYKEDLPLLEIHDRDPKKAYAVAKII